jgi:tetratricopeptide (TPR) repeat protein
MLVGACGPAPRAPRADSADYVFPAPEGGEVRNDELQQLRRAWRSVLAGDWQDAERRYRRVLAARPGLAAAETGLAYARLRGGQTDAAAAGFEAVLARAPRYVPALTGAASAALRRGDADAAFALLQRVLETSPGDPVARARLGELKLQVTERRVGAARTALAAGNREQALAEYRRALEAAPELADLRLELAGVLEEGGQLREALALLEAGAAGDRALGHRRAELMLKAGEPARAVEAYRALLAADAKDARAQRGLLGAQQALELQRQPDEYRRIPGAARVTRADLAALVSVRIPALGRLQPRVTRVATDVTGSWARAHILRLLALDVLDVYPNHTFQPGATVRKGDLAAAVGRVLELLNVPARPGPAPRDMSPAHLQYAAVLRVLASGLMDVTAKGDFEPWRPVSGRDAVAVVEALARLAGS